MQFLQNYRACGKYVHDTPLLDTKKTSLTVTEQTLLAFYEIIRTSHTLYTTLTVCQDCKKESTNIEGNKKSKSKWDIT